jgi:hypothetical protein
MMFSLLECVLLLETHTQPLSVDHSSDNTAEVRRIVAAGGSLLDTSSGTQRAAASSQRTGIIQIQHNLRVELMGENP